MVSILAGLLLAAPLAACSEKMASDGRAPRVDFPVLRVTTRPVPQEQQYDPMFSQVSLHGRVFSLPFSLRELVDDGWVLRHKAMYVPRDDGSGFLRITEFDTIGKNDSASVALDDAEGNSIEASVSNPGPGQVAVEDAQMTVMRISAQTVEPYPGIRRGVSVADVERILGKPDVADDGELIYMRDPLTKEQLSDLSGNRYPWPEYKHGPSRAMTAGMVRLSVSDDKLYGSYEIDPPWYSLSERHKIKLSVLDPYRCQPADYPASEADPNRPFNYSYSVPIELRAAAQNPLKPAYAAPYQIDGKRYAIAAAEIPTCDVMSYKTMAEQVAYLTYPNQGSRDGWDHRLLWNDKESSAAVTTFDGTGDLTGNEVMRVTLNYCDWGRKERVVLSFAIIGLDPGTKISDDARSYLLGTVSDVAKSIERT